MDYFGYSIVNPWRSHVPAGYYDATKGHTGIDIGTPEGTELSLPVSMTVGSYQEMTQMGKTLFLVDSSGKVVVFAHLSEVSVSVGQAVNAGQVFAKTGNTGTATTGPHLHLEVISSTPEAGYEFMTRSLGIYSGYNIDPETYLEGIFGHWSSEAMAWLLQHGLITQTHDPNASVTWGEMAVVSKRLAEKVLEWSRSSS